MVKYEVWGRKEIGKGRRQRLTFGLASEGEAKTVRASYVAKGWLDCVIVQRPPRYGQIAGLQRRGRSG